MEFARQAAGAPATRYWKAGDFISPDTPPPFGAWVATFDKNDKYYGHVGVFNGYDDDGTLHLIDQFNSRGYVSETLYHPKPEGFTGRISNDPSQYRILD